MARLSLKKTYVVAGSTKSGTSAMMLGHLMGGIEPLCNTEIVPLKEALKTGVYSTYEYQGRIRPEMVYGRVIKCFYDSAIRDMPSEVGNIHVVYMLRDNEARLKANPNIDGSRFRKDYDEKAIECITALSRDPRIECIIPVSFDRMIDQPVKVFERLVHYGWELIPDLAATAICPSMRHAVGKSYDNKGGSQ
jgi:hypothetical protein